MSGLLAPAPVLELDAAAAAEAAVEAGMSFGGSKSTLTSVSMMLTAAPGFTSVTSCASKHRATCDELLHSQYAVPHRAGPLAN